MYTKPEVTLLKNPVDLIQGSLKGCDVIETSSTHQTPNAYEADE